MIVRVVIFGIFIKGLIDADEVQPCCVSTLRVLNEHRDAVPSLYMCGVKTLS